MGGRCRPCSAGLGRAGGRLRRGVRLPSCAPRPARLGRERALRPGLAGASFRSGGNDSRRRVPDNLAAGGGRPTCHRQRGPRPSLPWCWLVCRRMTLFDVSLIGANLRHPLGATPSYEISSSLCSCRFDSSLGVRRRAGIEDSVQVASRPTCYCSAHD